MTSPDEIPTHVQQFVLAKIDSVPHLEALLIVWERASTVWTVQMLAETLYVDVAAARKIVTDLFRRAWIKKSQQSQTQLEASFVFDPSWDPDGQLMSVLSATYRRQLIRMTTLIHTNSSAGVREFARAFELKKE